MDSKIVRKDVFCLNVLVLRNRLYGCNTEWSRMDTIQDLSNESTVMKKMPTLQTFQHNERKFQVVPKKIIFIQVWQFRIY